MLWVLALHSLSSRGHSTTSPLLLLCFCSKDFEFHILSLYFYTFFLSERWYILMFLCSVVTIKQTSLFLNCIMILFQWGLKKITTVTEVCLCFVTRFWIFFSYVYPLIYQNIRFLNHQIFVSVSALKILYRSGSNINTQKRDKKSQFQEVELCLMELQSELCRN